MQTLNSFIKLFNQRSLIARMAYKDLTDRYAGSAFGLIWAILQPLFLIALYAFIFTFVFKTRIGPTDNPIQYAFYAIAGLIPWISMAESVSKAITSVSQKSALVKQAIFPTEILPLSSTLANFTPLLISLSIYLLMAVFLIRDQMTWLLLLLPIIVIIHFLFTLGLAYFMAIGGIYFKDLVELIGLILTVGMFITPILYIEGSIPLPLQFVMNFNLVAHLIYVYRDIIFYGHITHPWSFIIFPVAAVTTFILGNISFRKVQHLFANVL